MEMRNRAPPDNYYGNGDLKKSSNKEVRQLPSDGCFKQFMVILSSVLGVISLLALIALNIANLAEIYRSKQDANQLVSMSNTITSGLDSIKGDINDDLKPKTTLINAATSIKLPTLITSHAKMLQSDILKYCSPRYDNKGKECPVLYNPLHSGLFSLYDPADEVPCILQDGEYRVLPNITFITFASFVPSPSSPTGCTRIPSFSLSASIYSYTHNMIIGDCRDSTYSIQYWTIGKIISSSLSVPLFENIINWSMADMKNRKSCSTAAGSIGAWLACTIVTEKERDDYNTTGIQPLNIAYMDVYGRRRQWFYDEREITFDKQYDALYFSVGSGVIIEDTVYFLAYGGLRRNFDVNAYCYSPGCTVFDQNVCNEAQKPGTYYGKQTVNAIVSFQNRVDQKPRLTVKTIPQNWITLGAEGRLYYFPQSGKTYIYKRSTSWHALVFFGEIQLRSSLDITWYPIEVLTRPGESPCTGQNRCPNVCVTGVYTDYFPLAAEGYLGVSVILRHDTKRINPSIYIVTRNSDLLRHKVTHSLQKAAYSTTTCFRFDRQVWCLSIVEVEPGSIGKMQPVSVLYPIKFWCHRFNRVLDEGSGDDAGLLEDINRFFG